MTNKLLLFEMSKEYILILKGGNAVYMLPHDFIEQTVIVVTGPEASCVKLLPEKKNICIPVTWRFFL